MFSQQLWFRNLPLFIFPNKKPRFWGKPCDHRVTHDTLDRWMESRNSVEALLWAVGHYHFAVRLWVRAKSHTNADQKKKKSHTINSEREPERECELGSIFKKYFKLSKFVRAKIESKRKRHYKMIMWLTMRVWGSKTFMWWATRLTAGHHCFLD